MTPLVTLALVVVAVVLLLAIGKLMGSRPRVTYSDTRALEAPECDPEPLNPDPVSHSANALVPAVAPPALTAPYTGPDLTEVYAALEDGKKILAIKHYRSLFGVGLKDAKEAVEDLASGKNPQSVVPRLEPREPRSARLEEVYAAMASGKKIEAIKLYRNLYATNLKEAKEAVEAMFRGEPPPHAPREGLLEADPVGRDADVAAALSAGRKIEAIKIYRERHGVTLLQAKLAVEAM